MTEIAQSDMVGMMMSNICKVILALSFNVVSNVLGHIFFTDYWWYCSYVRKVLMSQYMLTTWGFMLLVSR